MRPSTFERVVDEVGSAIVDGRLPAERIETVDRLVACTGASRSIVREATRVLADCGLLRAGRRVGLRVLPAGSWNTLDPRVIHWRLAGSERAQQLVEVWELRQAVEPLAAGLAARRRTGDDAEAFGRLALALEQAGDDPETFLRIDQALHHRILVASGNAMLARLDEIIQEVLRDRIRHDRSVAARDLVLHRDLAEAVADGSVAAAVGLMADIVERAH